MKLVVITNSFIAGAVIDDKTGKVTQTDHWLHQLRGLTEQEFREKCRTNNWAVSVKE